MRTLLFFSFLLFTISTYAQENTERFSSSLVASVATPLGAFKNIHGKIALGADLCVMNKPVAHSALAIGIGVSIHVMDGDSYSNSTSNPSIEKSAGTRFISLFPKLRVQHPKNIAVSPFAEGMIGAHFFYVREKIITYTNSNDKITRRKWRDFSASPGFGVAAGINIPMSKDGNRLEIKSVYMSGRRSDHYHDPAYSSAGELSYTTVRSSTNLLMFQVGINL